MACPRSDQDRQTYSRADRGHLPEPRMDCARYIQDCSNTKATPGRRLENKRHRVFLFRKRWPRFESIREYILRLLSDKTRRLQYHSDSDAAPADDVSETAAGKDLWWRNTEGRRAW